VTFKGEMKKHMDFRDVVHPLSQYITIVLPLSIIYFKIISIIGIFKACFVFPTSKSKLK
jgi:hypothetical protein